MKKSIIIFLLFYSLGNLHAQEERSVQGAFGAVTIDGKIWNQIALRPVIPVWKFGIALDLVFYIDQDGNIHKDEWDFSDGKAIKNTLIDKIYYIRFGFRNDPLYFRLGALDYVKMGYGILVNGYSNSVEYPQVRKVGLDLSLRLKTFSVQGFVNDFKENMGLVGVRVQTPLLAGIPVGISGVIDRNQYLGLKDRDGDGYPDFVDDFPELDTYYIDSDGDGLADNHPEETDRDGDRFPDVNNTEVIHAFWDTLGSAVGVDFSSQTFYDSIPDDYVTLKEDPLNVNEDSDPVIAIAFDVGIPVINEQNMSFSIYAQAAKMIGKTVYPGTDSTLTLGSGIIPIGMYLQFGPMRFNLEYRMIPNGNFEFGYWNQTYEIERASLSTGSSNVATIVTKEKTLGKYGEQKGFYAHFGIDVGNLLGFNMDYQNLKGQIWDQELNDFSDDVIQNFRAMLELKTGISRIKTANLFYQQRNVPNPFKFEYTESTVMGYRIGLELGAGMVLNYTFQRTFRDWNGDGDVADPNETINLTGIETSFTF